MVQVQGYMADEVTVKPNLDQTVTIMRGRLGARTFRRQRQKKVFSKKKFFLQKNGFLPKKFFFFQMTVFFQIKTFLKKKLFPTNKFCFD